MALIVVVVAVLAVVASINGSPSRFQLRSQMTVEQFTRCGLHKLSAGELAALESWLNGKPASISTQPGLAIAPRALQPEAPSASGDPLVAFNTKSRKYHCPSCLHAVKCTRNCVEVRQSEAVQKGGVPCGACGGWCR